MPGRVARLNGSPPPARGALRAADEGRGDPGITPACAGSTRSWSGWTPATWDHPRLRGEHLLLHLDCTGVRGSPPPARGAPPPAEHRRVHSRITPACAGSTGASGRSSGSTRDHPRLRGEHAARAGDDGGEPGITPACAGSTPARPRTARDDSDHPRLRGEHRSARASSCRPSASPPPARGALIIAAFTWLLAWITPACAGSTNMYVLKADGHVGSPPPARGALQPLLG